MPSSATGIPLSDILHHIDLAGRFVENMDYEAFRADLRTIYAVTRCLEIISEATRPLPDDLKGRHPSIPWKRIAGAGNVYRHDYEDVAAHYLWETVQRDPPVLRAVVALELERSDKPR